MKYKLTPEDVDAIEAREKKTPHGPYEVTSHSELVCPEGALGKIGTSEDVQEFIAHSRTDVPNLVHDWRVFQARVQELEEELEWYADQSNYACQIDKDNWLESAVERDKGKRARKALKKSL